MKPIKLLCILLLLSGCGGQMAEAPSVVTPSEEPEVAVSVPEPEPTPEPEPEFTDLSKLDEAFIVKAAKAEGWITAIKPKSYTSDTELVTVAIRTDDRAGFVMLYKGKAEALRELQPRLGPATASGGELLLAVILDGHPGQAQALLKGLTAQKAPVPCCVTCKEGKPCGNTCIQSDWECHKEPGCACAGP